MIVDWKNFGRVWREVILEAIVATARAHPEERFYAGAFWLLHGDYSSILAPAFGLNVESTDQAIRWHPPDWRWSPIEMVHERVQHVYAPLEALRLDTAEFDVLWDQHIDVLASVAREVTTLARTGNVPVPSSSFAPAFFVGIIDLSQGDDSIDYLRRSVDAQTLADSGILEALASS